MKPHPHPRFSVNDLITIWLIHLCVVLITAISALAGGYALSGVGTRAVGMGGAFRGLADDWSAGYWNPAGLTQLDGWSVSLSNSTLFSRIKYRPQMPDSTPGFKSGTELRNHKQVFQIPNFSIYRHFDSTGFGMTAGVIFTIPYGLGASWDLYDPPSEFKPLHPYPTYDHESELAIYSIQPTLAYSITPTVSVGAGLGILRGSMLLKQVHLQKIAFPPYPYPNNYWPLDSELEGTGLSFNANFGLFFHPFHRWSFGMNVLSGATIPLEGEVKLALYAPQSSSLTAKADGTADLPVPWRYGAGACYRPLDSVKLTLDVEYVQWSAVDEIEVAMDGHDPLGNPLESVYIVKHWDDTFRISSGIEVDVLNRLTLMGGYYHETASMPKATIDPLVTSFGNLDGLTLGGGIRRGRFDVSAIYEVHIFSSTTVDTFADANGDGGNDNLPGEYSGAVHVANVNVNVYF
jgi:long-chain fatty acid transport protein